MKEVRWKVVNKEFKKIAEKNRCPRCKRPMEIFCPCNFLHSMLSNANPKKMRYY